MKPKSDSSTSSVSSDELKEATRDLYNLLQFGCSDGYCKMRERPPKGMHTNGGCRCVDSLADLSFRVALEAEKFTRGKRASVTGFILET